MAPLCCIPRDRSASAWAEANSVPRVQRSRERSCCVRRRTTHCSCLRSRLEALRRTVHAARPRPIRCGSSWSACFAGIRDRAACIAEAQPSPFPPGRAMTCRRSFHRCSVSSSGPPKGYARVYVALLYWLIHWTFTGARMTLRPILHFVALTCVLSAARAAPGPLPPEIVACASEPDAGRRVACYDREVRALTQQQVPNTAVGSAPVEPSAGNVKPSDAAGPGATPPKASDSSRLDEFGRDSSLKAAGERATSKLQQRLDATVESISRRNEGRLTLRLDNGQVWAQSEEGADLKLQAGDKVTITRGLLGSYWLSNGSRLAIKVRRTH
jgi:hypothetical protein